jgi:spore maturation protein CgeB
MVSKWIKIYLGGDIPTYQYFYDALNKIFSKVIVYDYPTRIIEIGPKAINDEIINIVRREHPKYVVWLSSYHEFLESTFDTIRKEGAILIGVFFDDEFRFDAYSKWWVPHLEYCLTNDVEAVPKFKELGGYPIHMPPPTGIIVEPDRDKVKYKYEVSFVGGKAFDRELYINEIKKRNIPIRVFGSEWERRVSFEEMINIFTSSKINLNFSKTVGNRRAWKGRVLEVCLAGGFLLTEYFPGIEEYFKIDKEIVCFNDAEEMVEKILYYLANENERVSIARAGWKKAISEYTPFHLMSKVFYEVEKDLTTKNRKSRMQPKKIKMTRQMRKDFSGYYLQWAVWLSIEKYKDKNLWKDALALSRLYKPLNIWACGYYLISFSPLFVRRSLSELLIKMKIVK